MLVDRLEKELAEYKRRGVEVKHFIVVSDGCPYQNRCTIISNALAYFAMTNNVKIDKYVLDQGHT